MRKILYKKSGNRHLNYQAVHKKGGSYSYILRIDIELTNIHSYLFCQSYLEHRRCLNSEYIPLYSTNKFDLLGSIDSFGFYRYLRLSRKVRLLSYKSSFFCILNRRVSRHHLISDFGSIRNDLDVIWYLWLINLGSVSHNFYLQCIFRIHHLCLRNKNSRYRSTNNYHQNMKDIHHCKCWKLR